MDCDAKRCGTGDGTRETYVSQQEQIRSEMASRRGLQKDPRFPRRQATQVDNEKQPVSARSLPIVIAKAHSIPRQLGTPPPIFVWGLD